MEAQLFMFVSFMINSSSIHVSYVFYVYTPFRKIWKPFKKCHNIMESPMSKMFKKPTLIRESNKKASRYQSCVKFSPQGH